MSRCVPLLVLFAAWASGLPAQQLSDLSTPLPVRPGETVVIGFLGGIDRWNDPHRGVRKLALDLRNRPGMRAETIENRHRRLARQFLARALDRNGDGVLDAEERGGARIILYGQSLGAEAALDLARALNRKGVAVLLVILVDSVGVHGGTIPPNVRAAANFYQHDLFTIWGRATIRAADPRRTRILGNFEFHYDGGDVDSASASWVRRRLGGGHARMELDPAVWQHVETLILEFATSHD